METPPHDIRVSARVEYIEAQSDPENEHFVFAYHIKIENAGSIPARLISRHWIITDAEGRAQEVAGLGVVGEQPVLEPGDAYEYTSGCALPTPVGTMRGTYQMNADDGTQFDAIIPEFVLAAPRVLH